MNLAEFLEKKDGWDGELVLNGANFDMTCSLCVGEVKFSELAFEKYGKVLKAEVSKVDENYIHCENKEFEDIDEAFIQGSKFLSAIAGYIADSEYKKCFGDL